MLTDTFFVSKLLKEPTSILDVAVKAVWYFLCMLIIVEAPDLPILWQVVVRWQ